MPQLRQRDGDAGAVRRAGDGRRLRDRADGGTLHGPAALPFTLDYPAGRTQVPTAERGRVASSSIGMIRRDDGRGIIVVEPERRVPAGIAGFSKAPERKLRRTIPDFQPGNSRIIRTRAGAALYYSYIRKLRGTIHAVVLVPAGSRSFAITTVSQGGADDVARQIALSIRSFGT